MMDFTLGEMAAACGGELVLRGQSACDTYVSSVVIDSRKVAEKGVFLATIGERVDGHRFIASVFEKGAVLAVTQKTPEQVEIETGIRPENWGSYLLVEDTLQALKDIAEGYRRKLNIPVVGITGSVGKTSTKEFIAGVLSEKYNVLKTEGNYNNEIGVPLTLLGIRREHTAAVVEMGISDFGEMHRLSRMVRPDICVITNIGQCHLENLKTRDGILKAKSEIFDFMAEDGQICLYGGDDKLCTLTEIKGRKPHFFGWGDNPLEEVTAGDVVSHGLWGSDAVLTIRQQKSGRVRMPGAAAAAEERMPGAAAAAEERMPGAAVSAEERIAVHVPLPGRHMVLNSAAAACVAGLLGLSPEQIVSGIGKIRPVSGRNNLIRLEDYTLIDDCYNANPASMKAAVDLLAMADTVKVAILGDMFELGNNSHILHEEIGAYAAAAEIDRIYCVGREAEYMYRAVCRQIALAGDANGQARGSALAGNANDQVRGSAYAGDAGDQVRGSALAGDAGGQVRGSAYAGDANGQVRGSALAGDAGNQARGSALAGEVRGGAAAECVNEPAGPAASVGTGSVQAVYFPAKKDLLQALEAAPARYIPKGSTILIKASHGMEFADLVEIIKNL